MNQVTNIDYSIIIPAYNEEEYLPYTLKSIIKSMKAISRLTGEIIVTDNNSTDSTAAIAKEYGARVIFEEHQQISRARNTGAKAALGKYLIFVDSDTLISPLLLEKTLNALVSERYCGGGAIAEFDTPLPILARLGLKAWLILSKRFKWACGAYLFCTREPFMETGGFDERYYASEEIYFSIALRRWGRKHGKGFIILEEPIITSSRKLEWYSLHEHLLMFLHMLLYLKPLQNRNACHKMWYERPNKIKRP